MYSNSIWKSSGLNIIHNIGVPPCGSRCSGGTPGGRYIMRCVLYFTFFFVFVIIVIFFSFLSAAPQWKYRNNYYCYKPFPAREKRPEHPVVPLCVGLINNYYSDKFARRTGSGGVGDGIWARRFPGPSCLNAKSLRAKATEQYIIYT